MLDFEIALDYPSYTGKKDETVTKNGDLLVPLGTNIGWTFYTRNTEEIQMSFASEEVLLNPDASNVFKYQNRLK